MPDRPHPLMILYRISLDYCGGDIDWLQSAQGIEGAIGEKFSTFLAVITRLKTCMQEGHSFPSRMPSTKT